VILHFEDGSTQLIGDSVSVGKAFPSVPFHDKEGNRYDLKGKIIPQRNPTAKARRKYVPRKQRTVPTDEVVSVDPAILEQIRLTVARALLAEREVHRLSVEATQHLSGDQVTSLTNQLANLTTKLTAAEARANEVEARAVRAEALLARTSQNPSLTDTVRILESRLKQSESRASDAAEAAAQAVRERNRLAERLDALERSQRQSAVASVPTGTTASVAPTVASKPATVQQSSAAAPSTPASVKPATVPIEQSVTRSAGQAVPSPAVKPAVLHRKTLSILKPGGRI
jgi:hypothetical protein